MCRHFEIAYLSRRIRSSDANLVIKYKILVLILQNYFAIKISFFLIKNCK